MAIDQELFDDVLTNAIDVLRLSAHERVKVLLRLKQLEKELLKKLAVEELTAREKKRIEKVIKEADELIDEGYTHIQRQLDLSGTAEAVGEYTTNALVVTLEKEVSPLPTQYIKSVNSNVLIQGSPAQAWWKKQAVNLKFNFAREVRQGLVNSETNQQIISRISGTKERVGIMEIARKDAAALVQTAVQSVANDARRTVFEENDDVITGIRQVSTLDSHTSIVCVSYSGAEWSIKDKKPINGNTLPYNGGAPRHFNCRSVEVPILKTFRELGIDIDEPSPSTRASSDGQISVNTSFDDFLKRKGRVYQEKVLGEGRAELWRTGKITLRDLLDKNGNVLTLAQLKEIARQRKGN